MANTPVNTARPIKFNNDGKLKILHIIQVTICIGTICTQKKILKT